MKARDIRHLVIAIIAALSNLAAAHPGNHDTAAGESALGSGVSHFLTYIDHIGPVILGLLLIQILHRKRSASRLNIDPHSNRKSP